MLDLCRFLSWFRPEHFFTGGSTIMDRDLNFSWKWWFEVKNILIMDLFLTQMQLLSSQDVNWWTGVVWITCGLLWCFYQLFGLSFWRHPFTAEDPLLRQWCNATFLQICSQTSEHSRNFQQETILFLPLEQISCSVSMDISWYLRILHNHMTTKMLLYKSISSFPCHFQLSDTCCSRWTFC